MRVIYRMPLWAIGCLVVGGALLAGCGTVSVVTLHGVYIEGSTGSSMAMSFDRLGANMFLNASYDKAKNTTYGDCILRRAKFTLIGDTVRLEGGAATALGKGLSMFSPSTDNGNVMLLKVTDNGQSLSYTNSSGEIVKFIKQ
jgi:hypothetical protein